jgi:hypothetical protein
VCLAVIPLGILMMIVICLSRPVEMPPALRPATVTKRAQAIPAKPEHPAANATTTSAQMLDDVTSPAVIDLSTIKDPEQRRKDAEMNRKTARLLADLDRYERDRVAWQRANDPDEMPPELWKRQNALLFQDYDTLGVAFYMNCPTGSRQRWNDLFMQRLIANQDWYAAMEFCNYYPQENGWQTALYCCQKMNRVDGTFFLGGHCLRRIEAWSYALGSK